MRNRLEEKRYAGNPMSKRFRSKGSSIRLQLSSFHADRLLKKINLERNKFLFDVPLLEHHNLRPFEVNGESTNRYSANGRKVMKPPKPSPAPEASSESASG